MKHFVVLKMYFRVCFRAEEASQLNFIRKQQERKADAGLFLWHHIWLPQWATMSDQQFDLFRLSHAKC